MELKVKSKGKTKKINIDDSIISIQYTNSDILDNLCSDYSVSIIDNLDDFFISKTVLDEISIYDKFPELGVVTDVMQLLGLSRDFFDKSINDTSTTEKIYLNILRNLGKTSDIIVFKDIFLGLDLFNQKKIKSVINYLKANNNTVIICSSDVNVLYNLADYSIICNNTSIKGGLTDEIYTDVKTLLKLELEVPTLPYITYKAKEEKNIKLFYSKDVRDIIKDIYKHV